jgi:hypothetical protein
MKRARFTASLTRATDNEVVRRVILCYTADQARAFYERQGWQVLEVSRGDYRKQPRAASGAQVDQRALREAIASLGLVLPVKVRYSSRTGDSYGRHAVRPTHPSAAVRNGRIYGLKRLTNREARWEHRIVLKSWLDADQMGRTLWHELAHALQFERDHVIPCGFDASALTTYRRHHASYRDGTSYSQKPSEREARTYEPRNDSHPLCRA